MSRRFLLRGLILCLALLPGIAPATAHPGSVAFWKIAIGDTEATSQILVSSADVTRESAAAVTPGAERPSDEHLVRLAQRVLPHFVVSDGTAPATARLAGVRLLPSGMLEVRAVHRLTGPSTAIALRATVHQLTDDSHRVMARVEHNAAVERLVFDAATPQHVLHVASSRPWHASLAPDGSARALLLAGVEHILTGYDHLLFLACLLLPGGRLRSRVAIVTAFTAAHSLTLVLAAMQIVTPPPRFVEAAIALSIAYVAIENLLVDGQRRRWPIAFGFGLIHGFGFAGMLDVLDLPVGQWVTSVLSFNLGVELGQLAVVGLAVPLLAVVARQAWHRRLVQCTSLGVLGLAAFWTVERLQ